MGPNVSDGITTGWGTPGDADLDARIPGFTTNDACVLEFDFECEKLQIISFQYVFTSDEYNGVTVDNQGNVRDLHPRSFASLSQAEEENGQSRIYLGIHWSFDKTEGIAQGRLVADHVFRNAFRRARR